MVAGAVAGAGSNSTSTASSTTGSNPFWSASNWYFEPNANSILNGSTTLTTAQQPFSLQLNSNGFLKDARIIVRSSGAVGGVPAQDSPTNLFQNLTFAVPNGSQFFQDHTGWYYQQYQAYGRPWEGDPTQWFDYGRNINPSFTLKLAPEVRYTAGCLPNMDDRRQYKIQGNVAAQGTITSGTITTAPTTTFAVGIDTWAQPDANDLMGRSNATAAPGQVLQCYRKKATQTLNGASASNTIDARSLTGNIQRLIFLVVRDGNAQRQDYLSDPITWMLDSRQMASYTTAALFGWMNDFYGTTAQPRPTGVYLFPRFFNPGSLVGQGWLQTSGATKEQWISTTLSTAANVAGGTIDICIEDVVTLAGLPYELTNI